MSNSVENAVEHRTLQFGGQEIAFTLNRTDRSRLTIEVLPDRSVRVLAPRDRTLEEILQRVRRRAAWIIRQQDYFERFQPLPPPRAYMPGETHLYLGRQYRLKVVPGVRDEVKLLGRFIRVCSTRPEDRNHTKVLVDHWYRVHAKAQFARRVDQCLSSATRLKVAPPRVMVRRMKTRWGSCSKNGVILLNTELIKAPVDCIDYVITHELCHLKIREHTPAFYHLLSRCMPDWERRKARLELVLL